MIESERHKLLIDWNNTTVDYPRDSCIHELFEIQVDKTPHAIAVIFENQTITYDELNKRANQLAWYLVNEKRVGPETLVGVCVDRSIDMVIAVLGVFKAGCAYVPLDPNYPEARLIYMLKDANLNIVIAQADLLQSLPITSEQALCLDVDSVQRKVEQQSIHNISTQLFGLTSGHLAYVIYTSGSTGNPKGSLLTHSGLCNLTIAQQKGFGVSSASRVLQFASLAFDAAISELAVTLCAGAQLLVVPAATIKAISELEDTVKKIQITHATLPPALLPLLDPAAWKSVHTLVIAGDACSIQIANQWSSDRTLINAYGPSETTVCATMGQYKSGQGVLHIGKPLQNVQVYVLDENIQLIAPGQPGELHIGGVGLSRGYLNRPDLTAEKFIINPFYDENTVSSSKYLYKTGDLVRWLPDGNLEFLGRIDHQVKIRGFRIELGEIENALSLYYLVKDAVVLAKTSTDGDKHLVGYVVINDTTMNHAALIDLLRQHLHSSLPDYMIPSAFVLLDKFPITPNGKIDRKALPEPDTKREQREYVEPKTDVEKALCQLWQDVLNINKVGITDNFYDLGGHSLKIIKLIAKMQTIGVEILVSEFIQHPTISGISLLYESKKLTQQYKYTWSKEDKLHSLPNRQLLFKSAYHNHWNIDGIIGIQNANSILLNEALRYVITGHQGLRSLYYLKDDVVYEQIIELGSEPILETLDLSPYPSQAERSKKIEEIAIQMQSSLDLTKRLFRFNLFLCGADEPARFVWVIHHSIIDGYSIGVFLQELFIRYLSLVANVNCILPPKATSIAEWGHHLHRFANSDSMKEHIDYWMSLSWNSIRTLMDFPEGLAKNRSSDKTLYGSDFSITKKLNSRYSSMLLAGNWKHKDVSSADIIFSAFSHTISTLTNSQYINFEMAVSGREKIISGVDLSRTIGWLIDDIPVFIKVENVLTSYDKVKYYNLQYSQIPASGLSFNALKHLSDDFSVRNLFHAIPRAEFYINYVPPFVGNLHDQDIPHDQVSQLPLHFLSSVPESCGEAYNVKDIAILWPTYIQINVVNGEYQFFWFTRDNIYKKSTVESALLLWIKEIETMLDSLSQ